jgi:hypothetical protein
VTGKEIGLGWENMKWIPMAHDNNRGRALVYFQVPLRTWNSLLSDRLVASQEGLIFTGLVI